MLQWNPFSSGQLSSEGLWIKEVEGQILAHRKRLELTLEIPVDADSESAASVH